MKRFEDTLRSPGGRDGSARVSRVSKLAMEDSVQICCTKCKGSFRDRARRVQSGYSRQCPVCEVLIFFEDGAIDRNVQRALIDARRLRRALRAEDEIRPLAPRVFAHRR